MDPKQTTSGAKLHLELCRYCDEDCPMQIQSRGAAFICREQEWARKGKWLPQTSQAEQPFLGYKPALQGRSAQWG